jgi:hypothetical protein
MVQYMQVRNYTTNSTRDTLLTIVPDPHRVDERFVRLYGKRKAFHKGGNSYCRLHIRQHYNLYKEKCENRNIPINHWAIFFFFFFFWMNFYSGAVN